MDLDLELDTTTLNETFIFHIFRFERFQTIMIDSAEQIRKYEELFKKKNFKVDDILYQAWLLFKWDSIGTQQEAFNHVLKKRKPANLQAKKKREKVAPPGAAKYNMNDLSWNPIFAERMEKEAKTKKKANNNNSKKGRPRSAAPSTVTSGALESAQVSDANSSNSKTGSQSELAAAASSAVTSEDVDSELPDINVTLSNPVLGFTSSKGKRKQGNNNNTSSKRTKLRSNVEVRGKMTSTSTKIVPSASVPKFPLDNGLRPLINDDDNEETISCDITNNNIGTKEVSKTFLDIDFDLDNDLQEVRVSSDERQASLITETVNSNSKVTRASGRLRSRGKSELSSDKVTSKPTSTASPAHNNNNKKGRVRSKGCSAASQTSVPITIIDNGEQIVDQEAKKSNEIMAKKINVRKYAKSR